MKLERSTPLLVLFGILAALAIWAQNAIIPFTTPRWGLFDYQLDLDVYRAGARAVLDGEPLYRVKLLGQMDYTYAPISIPFLIPFAWMSAQAAHTVWVIGIFAALYGVIMLGFRSLGHRSTWRLRGIAASLVIISTLLEPVRSTIWFGQINVFLMLLILWDLLRDEKSVLRGAGTGLAAGIKLTPLLFAVYLVAIRQWKAAATLAGGFAATIAVGFAVLPRDSWDYWTGTLFDADRVAAPQTTGNQSIRGALANLGHTDTPSTLAWLVLAGLVALLGLGAAVLAHRHGQELLALSLVGMTSCAVSPVAWGHHWVWLLPLLIVALHLLLTLPGVLARGLVGAGIVGGFLLAFPWRRYISHAIWYVNESVPDAQLTGLFMRPRGHWYWCFTVQPYNLILVAVAVAVIVVYGLRDRSWRVPGRGRAQPSDDAVGPRR
ncbi:glycosyltransferase 87 family protein [Gordonia sp. PP30]|uniref:glycosyltransferase 87 family protein n=1 Tax=Gordonia sp. PP30 TaxID=2935861 RepID=UPI001FFEB065|nr:glycosyltransferase 87 family protein [Gordonia sp. PP30]UQE75329.1 glycosyltransferase 87 family protein [Gordonia sp. PP30]